MPQLQWNKIIHDLFYIRIRPLREGKSFRPFFHWWKGVRNLSGVFKSGVSYKLGNGSSIDFWSDRWCGEVTLQSLFPDLFWTALGLDSARLRTGTALAEYRYSTWYRYCIALVPVSSVFFCLVEARVLAALLDLKLSSFDLGFNQVLLDPRHDDRELDTIDHACLPLCSFAHACEGRSPQAGTPEIAYATQARPCGIGRRNGMPWRRLIPRVGMLTTTGPFLARRKPDYTRVDP
uniref:Reverse transcriptase zinc-binding domain-containing protein n=1 Tax=Ananas comosus var. bracteatus TaxID=296719 RepID=A0A6V7PXV0_ANACO|nr:unnamed protein product [Ananas comosus var. bracteatus]